MTRPSSAVIQLNQLSQFDDFPAYVGIYSTQVMVNPFLLSPVAMQWSEHIILNRVRDCEAFWVEQKQKAGEDLENLFRTVLSHYYGDDFIAVFAAHPWQCLLYLTYQHQHASRGMYFLQSRLNQNIYRSLNWQIWFANQPALATHLESINAKGFNADRFRARQSQLKRFIGRIGLAGPFELKQVDYQAFSRRFETWLAKVWRWTMKAQEDLQGFPWITLQQAEPPAVARDLEYSVSQWSVVEVLLREDLMRLSELMVGDDQQHINRMNWQIVLFNQQTVEVELSFRQPYSLHRDKVDFKTALYQARYIYETLIRELQQRDQDLDLPETMPLIAWRIEVCEYFNLAPVIWDLFGFDSEEKAREGLFNLQNKLPVVLESYACASSFYPEQTFTKLPLNEKANMQDDQIQWSSQSIHRPLFYYQSAQQIEAPARHQFSFLERCANHWWQLNNTQATNRDYYRLTDCKGRASWIYRDFDGNWFKQGEYC